MEELNKILEQVESSIQNNEEVPQEFAIFGALLSLDDEKFKLVAPMIQNELKKQYSDPQLIYGLLAELKKNGEDINSLSDTRQALEVALNEVEELSQIKKDFVLNVFDTLINELEDTNMLAPTSITIPIELLSDDIKVPTYANIGDAGMDIYSPADYTINPGETVLIKCGFKVAIPNGYELQVRPKSGLSLKSKLRVANAPGTIDSGYRDEVGVIIENLDCCVRDLDCVWKTGESDHELDKYCIQSIEYGRPYYIEKGQKFAQLVLQKVPTARFQVVESIDAIAGDRGGGFGSSGKF